MLLKYIVNIYIKNQNLHEEGNKKNKIFNFLHLINVARAKEMVQNLVSRLTDVRIVEVMER